MVLNKDSSLIEMTTDQDDWLQYSDHIKIVLSEGTTGVPGGIGQSGEYHLICNHLGHIFWSISRMLPI